MPLRYERLPPLRVIFMIKEVRDGVYGETFLGGKELNIHTWKSIFSWTTIFQFFPKPGRFTPIDHACLSDH